MCTRSIAPPAPAYNIGGAAALQGLEVLHSCLLPTLHTHHVLHEHKQTHRHTQTHSCRWVVYRHTLTLFRQLEDELLRVGTHYLECYAHQLHAVGRGAEMEELSRWVGAAFSCTHTHTVLLLLLTGSSTKLRALKCTH